MKCLSCKQKPGTPKYCSLKCQNKAKERLGRIIDGLRVKKMPWGEEKVIGKEENEL